MMKMPLPTVLSKYHRAMKKLRLWHGRRLINMDEET